MLALPVLFNILTLLSLFINLHIGLPHWTWKGWLIAFLISVIVSLLIILEAVYRYHTRTVGDQAKVLKHLESSNRAQIKRERIRADKLVALCAVAGAGKELYERLTAELYRDKGYPSDSKHAVEVWQAGLESAIVSRISADALVEFREGSQTSLPIPDSLEEQRNWVSQQYQRLNMLIGTLAPETAPENG